MELGEVGVRQHPLQAAVSGHLDLDRTALGHDEHHVLVAGLEGHEGAVGAGQAVVVRGHEPAHDHLAQTQEALTTVVPGSPVTGSQLVRTPAASPCASRCTMTAIRTASSCPRWAR